MPITRIRLGVRVACIAVAATVGGLMMLAAARNDASSVFALAGWRLAPSAPAGAAAAFGALMHTGWIAAWSVVYTAVARTHRGVRTLGDAVLISVVAAVLAPFVGPALSGPISLLSAAERALLHVILALALAAGMRLARTW